MVRTESGKIVQFITLAAGSTSLPGVGLSATRCMILLLFLLTEYRSKWSITLALILTGTNGSLVLLSNINFNQITELDTFKRGSAVGQSLKKALFITLLILRLFCGSSNSLKYLLLINFVSSSCMVSVSDPANERKLFISNKNKKNFFFIVYADESGLDCLDYKCAQKFKHLAYFSLKHFN